MTDQAPDYPTTDKQCARNGFHRPAWAEDSKGFCLYHSPENGKTEETARQVWAEARRKAEGPDPNFSGWHFPDNPGAQGFAGATFEGHALFAGATFYGDALFWDAAFHGDTWFTGTTFQKTALFRDATFQGDASFRDATFQGNAGFGEATFGGAAVFDGATFRRKAWFGGATFQEFAWFQGAKFEPGINVQFDTPSPWSWLWGRRPFRRTEAGETAYRLAKQAAQARGDYTEAGRYHYVEQCAIEARRRYESRGGPPMPLGQRHGFRQRLKWWVNRFCTAAFWVWLLRLLFGRIIFGYGERPYYPLFIALAVIACWTGLYYSLDAIDPSPTDEAAVAAPATLGESLYFSVVTFTTLGYGDFKPKPDYRLLAGAEAALGAGLMATFIVCLTRKYMR